MLRLALDGLDGLGREDSALMESVQANLATGGRREIVFGRNGTGLQQCHRMRDAALAAR